MPDDPDVFTYGDVLPTAPIGEPRARRSDPDTSHAAARSVSADTGKRSRRDALYVLTAGPATHETIADRVAAEGEAVGPPRYTPSRLRTAVAELVDVGLVVDTGIRERIRSGRRAIVWALAPYTATSSWYDLCETSDRYRRPQPDPSDVAVGATMRYVDGPSHRPYVVTVDLTDPTTGDVRHLNFSATKGEADALLRVITKGNLR
jgi:hypothetical protein